MSEHYTFSEPPLNQRHPKTVTMPDVAMRLVQDFPIYIVITLVGILAIRGAADARDFIITGMGSLLAKSWPKPINVGGNSFSANSIVLLIGFAAVVKCLVA